MVDTVDNVRVRVSADGVGTAERELKRWRRSFDKATGGVAGSMQRAESQIRGSSAQISSSLRAMAASFGAVVGAREIVQAADSYTRLTNGLIAAGTASEDMAYVQDRLYAAAARNGTQAEALSQLYRRAALAGDALGASQETLLKLTDGVASALRVEGISATDARGPLLQLGQALASPIVRAEELNSLMEGVPEIARAAARGFGVSIADMRTAILDGKVTNTAFFQALQIGLVETEKLAAQLPLTIGNSYTVLTDALTRYIGQTDKALGASERIAAGINLLADNIDLIVPALAALSVGLGVGFVTNAVAAQVAARGVVGSMVTMRASILAAFGGPVGIAIAAIGVGLALVAVEAGRASAAAGDLRDSMDRADDVMADASKKISTVTQNTKDLTVQTEDGAVKMETFAGKTGMAAQSLYEYAKAQKAAMIADLERERENVSASVSNAKLRSPDLRRGNLFTPAGSLKEEVSRVGRFVAGELNNIWTGGVSDQELAKAVDDGMAKLSELDAKIAETRNASEELFARGYNPPSLGGGSGSDKTGAKAAENAEKRRKELEQTLADERRLLELEAAGDKAAIQAEKDRQREAELTKQYTESGSANAAQSAKEHLAYETQIRLSAERRAKFEQQAADALSRMDESADRIARRTQQIADLRRDELEYTLEIARLTGDKAGEESARRELMLVEQIARYRSIGMNTADATDAARRRVDEIISAESRTSLKEMFRQSFTDGVMASINADIDDWALALSDRLYEKSADALGAFVFELGDKLFESLGLDDLVNSIFGTSENIQTGTEIGVAQNAVLTPALISASATMATTLSAAITTAGSAAAAAMAAAISGASVGNSLSAFALDGARAMGGPVRPGGAYLVGERGPEILKMGNQAGNIIPNSALMNMPDPSRMLSANGGGPIDVRVRIDDDGGLQAYVERTSYGAARAMGSQAVRASVERSARQMKSNLPAMMKKQAKGLKL